MRTIRSYRDKLSQIVADSPQLYRLTTIDALLESVMSQMNRIFGFENAFYMCGGISSRTAAGK